MTRWLLFTFVLIPKKPRSPKCDDYGLISLINQVLKIFLRIINTRLYNKCETENSNTQFGFRNGMGTREAIFTFSVVSQRCLDVNQNLYECFVDCSKAFDNVKHEKLLDIFQKLSIDYHEV